jgi:hypothetical protein
VVHLLRSQLPVRVVLSGVFCLPIGVRAAQDTHSPTASEIVRRSVAVNTADWQAQPQYSYREHDVKSKVDADGRATIQQMRGWEVMMIDGTPYNRLISTENEPLRGSQEQQERDKLSKEVQKRQNESASDRQARLSKYQSSREEEHLLMDQMVKAFRFELAGEERLGGFDCYVLDAKPDPNYRPPVEKARVLTGMQGRLWIDKNQFHWVKVEAEVVSPVEFGLFIAKVKPGTRFELDQSPVGNVWLPKCFTETVNASVLGLYGYRTKEEEHYSDYRRDSQLSAHR